MKIIDLGHTHPTLDEVMSLAQAELVVLRKPDGSVFALSPVDDFDVEVELLKITPSSWRSCSSSPKKKRRSRSRTCEKNWACERLGEAKAPGKRHMLRVAGTCAGHGATAGPSGGTTMERRN